MIPIPFIFIPALWVLGASGKIAVIATGALFTVGFLATAAAVGAATGIGATLAYLKVKNDKGPQDLMHPYSEIAAANWTEPVGNATKPWARIDKSLLFYQDPYNAIIVSTRDHETEKWITVNITYQLDLLGTPIRARSGTPMAATASPSSEFEAVFYFMDNHNKTVEIRSKDHSLHSWVPTNLGNNTNLYADYYSQLSAHWFKCFPDCKRKEEGIDQVRVFFQKSNMMEGAISAPWSEADFYADFIPGSGIAAIPYVPASGPMEMRLFFDNSSRLTMMNWRADTGWTDDKEFSITKQRDTYIGQNIAATSFQAAKETMQPAWYIVALQLQMKGSVRATIWDPLKEKWSGDKGISFRGLRGGRKFTRIALNQNRKFYGVRKGVIDEYTIDAKKPTRFRFSSRVALRNRIRKINIGK